jgi:hypothetical protein
MKRQTHFIKKEERKKGRKEGRKKEKEGKKEKRHESSISLYLDGRLDRLTLDDDRLPHAKVLHVHQLAGLAINAPRRRLNRRHCMLGPRDEREVKIDTE